MEPIRLYCATCMKHTTHVHLIESYATRCIKCNRQTSQLERVQVEDHTFATPDGVTAQVVEHTPESVTYYIPHGEYAGYLYYEKGTKQFKLTPVEA